MSIRNIVPDIGNHKRFITWQIKNQIWQNCRLQDSYCIELFIQWFAMKYFTIIPGSFMSSVTNATFAKVLWYKYKKYVNDNDKVR